ncbi:MAG: FkbM family methyltransferase [Pseudomonadota bacterium]
MMSDYSVNTWLNPVVQSYERFFGQTLKPVVWEVGSRDGRDGVELARRIYSGQETWFWSNATVVCMEPNPMQADIIRAEYPEVEVLELAASNSKGSAPFMVYEGDEGAVGCSSLNLDWKENDLPGHKITVKTDTLENLIGDQQVDIMKIDVEGHSMAVIEGLGDKLKQVKVFHIETEKWTDSNIKMKAFMMGHGYTLFDETEQYGGMPDQVWVKG